MITLDISQSVYKGTGSARFITDLTKTILDYSDNEFFSFFFSGLKQKLDNSIQKSIKAKKFKLYRFFLPPKLLSFIWNQMHILPVDFFIKTKVFLSSDWTEPPTINCKKATILHDLAFLRFPNVIHPLILKTQRQRLKWIIKESSLIITDATATVSDIKTLIPKHKKILGLSETDLDRLEKEIKVEVVYPGVKIPKINHHKAELILKKFGLKPNSYFLSVGKIEPRKNLKRLITAFNQITTKKKLIIVGPEGWDKLKQERINRDNIIFTGFITDNELFSLYANAYAFVFASIWEGFGYPLIEAGLSKTPIICSNIEIFNELIGKNALYFNPKNTKDIAEKLQLAEQNPNLINKNIQPAYNLSQKYNWKNYYNSFKQILINLCR
ncbi:MAG: glycosyl transferase family 1 [Patescibacteria group bacterium]|nr:MAG: glycosyl transferase family 1 [Patescibacteria group bacterium]